MTDKLIPLRIAGVGYSLPETVITNDDLTKLYETLKPLDKIERFLTNFS